MNSFRPISSVYPAQEVQMGPARIRQAFPVADTEQVDPFILLHHFDFTKGPGEHNFNVPPHPHRGFMPITYMFDGAIEHTDSLGNHEVIGAGEVQWINAASGIVHGESVGKEFAGKGGRFQGIQLWINLPAKEKMKAPSYQPLTRKELVIINEDKCELTLVSGAFNGKKGPAHSNVFTAMLNMPGDGNFSFDFPASNNVAIYVLEGNVMINEDRLAKKFDTIVFGNGDGPVTLFATEASRLLVMAGEPINEPVFSHGPFVMNTQAEIVEAIRDYQAGKMGEL